MSADAMDIDPPIPASDERKRKHKHKDSSSPSKKRKYGDEKKPKSKSKSKSKHHEEQQQPQQLLLTDDTPFTLTTATMYLPLSPISISATHALASLQAEHLSPLLLTYYPPFRGVILAYSNASISSSPPRSSVSKSTDPNPQPLTLAASAGEYGVLYVYLTATFLVFRPQRGQILEGWVNVQSEGFLGAVVLNLFSVGIERKRLPTDWSWVPPGEETRKSTTGSEDDEPGQGFDSEKEHFRPVTLASEENPLADAMDGDHEAEVAEGAFQSVSGHRVNGTVRFRVVDVDVIPGTDRERGFLSIEGTMLTQEEEARVVEEERKGVVPTRRHSPVPGTQSQGQGQGQSSQGEPSQSGEQETTKKEKEKKKKEKKSKKKSQD